MAKSTRERAAGRFDSLEQEVFLNLWRTYDRLRMLEDELFEPFGVTPQQYNVLRLLQVHATEGLQTLKLAAKLVSRAPDITRMLDKLEQQQLITRTRRADNRRVVDVHITQRGTELLERISEPLRACHTRQLGHMKAADLKQLCALLKAARQPLEDADTPWTG